MPKVLNKRTDVIPKGAVYVGRPTKWGNPFIIGKHGSREQCVKQYKEWIQRQQIDLTSLRGKDLVCWCSPESCHADVLLALANE